MRSICLAVLAAVAAMAPAAEPKSRTFRFTYAATVTGLRPGQSARVWLPLPPSNAEQDARLVSHEPAAATITGPDPQYGNRFLYVNARADDAGATPLTAVYRVRRREVRGEAPARDGENIERFLRADAKVPVGGKPLTLLEGVTLPRDPLGRARTLYDVVNGRLRYDKQGVGWGQGDAVWACDHRRGNCSDFHSLFISLARSQQIPAKFEIGFPLPPARGKGEVAGYHCWAWFKPPGHGWLPVDISEANKHPDRKDYYFGNLTEDRVLFSVGRDLTLVPRQDGPPLNFFIYPYVEVDGKPYPDEKVRCRFTYEDRAP